MDSKYLILQQVGFQTPKFWGKNGQFVNNLNDALSFHHFPKLMCTNVISQGHEDVWIVKDYLTDKQESAKMN